jgi:WXG100 family type VII secretion target
MAITHGMNIEAVEKLGTDLKAEAAKVAEISSKVTKLLADAKNNWKGPDADKFEGEWTGTYKSKMNELQKKLEDLGSKATHNAKDQRTTSSK